MLVREVRTNSSTCPQASTTRSTPEPTGAASEAPAAGGVGVAGPPPPDGSSARAGTSLILAAPARRRGAGAEACAAARAGAPLLGPILLGSACEQPGQPNERHFHQQPGRRGKAQLGLRLPQQPDGADEPPLRKRLRPRPHLLQGLRRQAEHRRAGLQLHQEQVAEVGQVVPHQLAQVLARTHHLVQPEQGGPDVALDQVAVQGQELIQRGRPQHGQSHVKGDLALRRVGHHLIQQRQGVAHPAVGLAGDGRERLRARPQPLRGEISLSRPTISSTEMPAKSKRWQRERIVAALLRLGRRQDELHMRRRLLQRLQQRVERRLGEHVHFVDDVDLEPARRAAKLTLSRSSRISSMPRLLAASISITSMSSPEVMRRQTSHSLQGSPLRGPRGSSAPWPGCGPSRSCPCRAVHTGRHDEACPARAARSAGCGDMLLSDDVAESLGTILPIQCKVSQADRSCRNRTGLTQFYPAPPIPFRYLIQRARWRQPRVPLVRHRAPSGRTRSPCSSGLTAK